MSRRLRVILNKDFANTKLILLQTNHVELIEAITKAFAAELRLEDGANDSINSVYLSENILIDADNVDLLAHDDVLHVHTARHQHLLTQQPANTTQDELVMSAQELVNSTSELVFFDDTQGSAISLPEPAASSVSNSRALPTSNSSACLCPSDRVLYESDTWVTLNVGGTHFTTTRETLTKCTGSMLELMFSKINDNWTNAQDRKGAYLIDRSPQYFGPLLNFLRQGVLVLDKGVNPRGVLEEARFFGLHTIMGELEDAVDVSDNTIDRKLTRAEFVRILMNTQSSSELRCQGIDFSGVDLSYLDLRSINFKHSKMVSTNLTGCNLENCLFNLADLSNATLDYCQLGGTQMPRVKLDGASMKMCKFENSVDFANLEGADMRGANLEGSQLSKVNLRLSTLKEAQLKNCVLRETMLAGADLENCNLTGSDLQGANLRGANVVGTIFLDIVSPLHMVHLM